MGHKGTMAHKNNAATYMMDGAAQNGSPTPNLNKGYGHESPGQERKDLSKMPGAYKQMDSGGSWMSQHSNTSGINMNTPPPGSAAYQISNDGGRFSGNNLATFAGEVDATRKAARVGAESYATGAFGSALGIGQETNGPTSDMFGAKSKKHMRYEKIAQKAENAIANDNHIKNKRLVNKANKLNKKNNLGNNAIARG